jgi:agmatine deiminase
MNAVANLRMPAEWEPHTATWIAWPHHQDDWPGKFVAIPWAHTEIVRYLHRSEMVNILVNDRAGEMTARGFLNKIAPNWERINFWRIPTDRVWVRDSMSPFVLDERGRLAVVKWRFNAWAKYDNWKRDNAVMRRILNLAQRNGTFMVTAVINSASVLEGGSIDVNGVGTLLTTEECLLSEVQQRNPGFSREDYERLFAEHLGVKKVLWLGDGISGDDTHGHIDDLARFVDPRTVVAVVEEDRDDVNYRPLRQNLKRLQAMTDQDDRPLKVVPLPMPRPLWFDGIRLPASYANFYIANTMVLVPTFNDPADRVALETLAKLFPSRTVVGIHAVDLVWGLGTLHCLTQQQPR